MLKIILSTLISVFLVISTITIFYWRDSKFDPSAQQISIYLGLIPLVISIVLLMPYLSMKWYTYHQKKKLQAEKNEVEKHENLDESNDKKKVEHIQLQVFSAFLESAMGKNQDVFLKVAEMSGPELDGELENPDGITILSYRIQDFDVPKQDENDVESFLNPLQQRIHSFISHQFQENLETLSLLAEHLKQSAMFYDSQLAYEYRMHPAWINPNADIDEEEIETVPVQIYRLNHINIHVILADHLLHVWDESSSHEVIEQFLDQLGIISQQVKIDYHYWGSGNAYYEWINLLKNIQNQENEVSLILVVDSELDQETVDERMWVTDQYVPAEFMSSCCLAAMPVKLENLDPVKEINLRLNEPQIMNSLSDLNIAELPQYEMEQGFVVIPDSVMQAKIVNMIAKNFKTSPIESYHYIYSETGLGHTQHLAKIFSFMLGLHATDGLYSFIYSVELPSTQVIIKPVQEEALIESVDS